MTRAEFIRAYAERSNLPSIMSRWADLGYIEIGNAVRIALPCACGDDACEGWVMVSATMVDDHLQTRAPEKLRDAYREAIGDC